VARVVYLRHNCFGEADSLSSIKRMWFGLALPLAALIRENGVTSF